MELPAVPLRSRVFQSVYLELGCTLMVSRIELDQNVSAFVLDSQIENVAANDMLKPVFDAVGF